MPIELRGSFLARCLPATLIAAALGATVFSGCGQKRPGEGASDDSACLSNRKFFETKVWGGFMSTNCIQCHVPDGDAVAQGAKFVLEPPSYPGFVDANLATLKEISNFQYQGTSELLVKPLGGANHGGGVRIASDGPEIATLRDLVQRFQDGEPCPDVPSKALADVQLMDSKSTLRKASLDLGGRLPTVDELSAVADGKDTSLDAALNQLMQEDVFYTRLKEIWNDLFLTDKFLAYGGAAMDFVDEKDYPAIGVYKDGKSPESMSPARGLMNRAIAQEPVELISYVVRNERPFTEIVTAPYALVNAYSGYAYGVNPNEPDPNVDDPNIWSEAQVTLGTGYGVPHAGILSTPAFLNRWQTTATNRNRGRARRVYLYFLATDILKIATRPVDATKVTAENNPTRNSPACTVCHKLVDPVAAGFRGWHESNYEDFDPVDTDNRGGNAPNWYPEMFEAGFGDQKMPPSSYGAGVQWLGAQVAKDPRFAINAVYVMFTGLTGHKPLLYPTDTTNAQFGAQIEAWDAQDAFFRATTADFQKNGYNLKGVVKAIVKSAYYRAASVTKDEGAGSDALLAEVGTGRLLTPEMMNRKVAAVTGFHWRKYPDPKNWADIHDWFVDENDSYKITYGGIDSDTVPTRLTEPNGMTAAVAHRMANEMACSLTAYDFTLPSDQRHLFPNVDVMEAPESAGHTVDGSVNDIRTNIKYLHKLLLDEDLDINDPEIDRTYSVFLDTWHELSATPDQTDIIYDCQGRIDLTTGQDLADDQKITKDKTFTVRSWQAVMTYLLSDWKFLYQ